jgi:large subunit ribosomal protein L4
MKLDVIKLDASSAGDIELADEIFGHEPRTDILHRMVNWQMAKARAGDARTKTRAEVRGANRKIWRQKGTGNARHGNNKAPQFRGGGKAHGPKPRDYTFDLPKKVRRLALMHALSAKARGDALTVLDEAALAEPKTKALKEAFAKLGWSNALIIGGPELDRNFALAARNIPNVDVLPAQGINVRDILKRERLVLTREAVAQLEARLK